jgi:transcriptional regulator with XRE-family HTH domain
MKLKGHSMTDRKLKILLKEWREKAGLTQERLAEALGVRQSQISLIENGHTYVSVQRLIEIKEALNNAGVNCSLDDLVEYEVSEDETAPARALKLAG